MLHLLSYMACLSRLQVGVAEWQTTAGSCLRPKEFEWNARELEVFLDQPRLTALSLFSKTWMHNFSFS